MSLPEELEQKLNVQRQNSLLQAVHHPLIQQFNLKLFIKRDDLLHPIISGNKWRKLKYIISDAIDQDFNHIISMGGAYSNHLHALAYVGNILGLKTTGLIRGEEINNPTINDLKQWGMNCIFIDRSDFRKLRTYKTYDSKPAKQYSGYWIPEGAATNLALEGVAEMLEDIDISYDYISLACGTGTTLAGLIRQLPESSNALGFSVLNNTGFLQTEISNLTKCNRNNWQIINDYHFGSFAKTTKELNKFCHEFSRQTEINIEPVYTGKLLFGLFDLVQRNYFKPNQTIIAYHSGGLQGARYNT